MSTFTTQSTKHTSTATSLSKNVVSVVTRFKGGGAWTYDDPRITYDGPNESITNMPIYYESVGTLPTFTTMTKH